MRELEDAELVRGFDFTKGAPVLKVPALSDANRPPMQGGGFADVRTRLYDLSTDPKQEKPFRDNKIEAGMNASIVKELMRHEAPAEIYDRFGLNQGSTA